MNHATKFYVNEQIYLPDRIIFSRHFKFLLCGRSLKFMVILGYQWPLHFSGTKRDQVLDLKGHIRFRKAL